MDADIQIMVARTSLAKPDPSAQRELAQKKLRPSLRVRRQQSERKDYRLGQNSADGLSGL